MLPAFVVALLVAGAAPPSAPGIAAPRAEFGPEQAVLDAYLRQYDRVDDLPYCGRIAPGGEEPVGLPFLPVRSVNGTNTLMDHHMAWHARHTTLRGTEPLDDNNTYGDDFVLMHRVTIHHYDEWRLERGENATPAWDPSDAIPPAFAYSPPSGCQPRTSEDPAVPLPTWLTLEGGDDVSPLFGLRALCEFTTMNRLGKELDDGDEALPVEEPVAVPTREGPDNYHSQVHRGVGGDMTPPETSMRDPVFWAWHKHLDLRVRLWETECAHREPFLPEEYADGAFHESHVVARPPPGKPEAPPPARAATPGPELAPLLALALAGALVVRSRRGR